MIAVSIQNTKWKDSYSLPQRIWKRSSQLRSNCQSKRKYRSKVWHNQTQWGSDQCCKLGYQQVDHLKLTQGTKQQCHANQKIRTKQKEIEFERGKWSRSNQIDNSHNLHWAPLLRGWTIMVRVRVWIPEYIRWQSNNNKRRVRKAQNSLLPFNILSYLLHRKQSKDPKLTNRIKHNWHHMHCNCFDSTRYKCQERFGQ